MVRAKHLGHNTAEYTARPTALTMAVALKAVIDALYHQTFYFCITLFEQIWIRVTWNNWQASEACDETSSGPVLVLPVLRSIFSMTRSAVIDKNLYSVNKL